MSSFSESNLEKKLNELNGSQQSIETLSLWLIHHRKHHLLVAKVWLAVLHKHTSANKKLILMYLANDVIQNSKRKGPEFSISFIDPLATAFHHIAQGYPNETKLFASLNRIITIWKERKIYEDEVIARFCKSMGDKNTVTLDTLKKKHESSSVQSSEPAEKRRRQTSSFNGGLALQEEIEKFRRKSSAHNNDDDDVLDSNFKPPDPSEIIRALLSLENAASTDAVVREKIAKLSPAVSDVSMLTKIQDQQTLDKLTKDVSEACGLLSAYDKRLDEEICEREKLSKMLTDFRKYNNHMIRQTEKSLEEYKQKLQKAIEVREELKSHANNLPDMSKLPNVASGRLVPLPAAGELFTK